MSILSRISLETVEEADSQGALIPQTVREEIQIPVVPAHKKGAFLLGTALFFCWQVRHAISLILIEHGDAELRDAQLPQTHHEVDEEQNTRTQWGGKETKPAAERHPEAPQGQGQSQGTCA